MNHAIQQHRQGQDSAQQLLLHCGVSATFEAIVGHMHMLARLHLCYRHTMLCLSGNGSPEVDAVEAVEHALQRLRRVEVLQLVHRDDLLQLGSYDLLDVAGVTARTLQQPSIVDGLQRTSTHCCECGMRDAES